MIRHALPDRVEGVAAGADPGLTELGRQQAKAMASWLADEDITAIHSSTAARALQTAAPLADQFGLDVQTTDDLLEIDWGNKDYIPFEKLRAENSPQLARWAKLLLTPIDDLPVAATFVDRIATTVRGILDNQEDGTVAIVSHGGVINAWTAHLIHPRTIFVTRTEYTGFSRYVHHDIAGTGTAWVVETLNEYPHLHGTDLLVERS